MENRSEKKASRNLIDEVIAEIDESIKVKSSLKKEISNIIEVANLVKTTLNNNGKIILCGNGGSAADSQHIAAEFVGKFGIERNPLPAIALTTNSSILTAIGNDFSFTEIFSRQIKALCNSNDILIGISTSGKSMNVIKAIEEANKIGAMTVALTGNGGGNVIKLAKKSIKVPSNNTQRIQESHILIGHMICYIVEKDIISKKSI